jgi:hypothetical protein
MEAARNLSKLRTTPFLKRTSQSIDMGRKPRFLPFRRYIIFGMGYIWSLDFISALCRENVERTRFDR